MQNLFIFFPGFLVVFFPQLVNLYTSKKHPKKFLDPSRPRAAISFMCCQPCYPKRRWPILHLRCAVRSRLHGIPGIPGDESTSFTNQPNPGGVPFGQRLPQGAAR